MELHSCAAISAANDCGLRTSQIRRPKKYDRCAPVCDLHSPGVPRWRRDGIPQTWIHHWKFQPHGRGCASRSLPRTRNRLARARPVHATGISLGEPPMRDQVSCTTGRPGLRLNRRICTSRLTCGIVERHPSCKSAILGDGTETVPLRHSFEPPTPIVGDRLNLYLFVVHLIPDFQIHVEIREVWSGQVSSLELLPHLSVEFLQVTHKRWRVEQRARIARGAQSFPVRHK